MLQLSGAKSDETRRRRLEITVDLIDRPDDADDFARVADREQIERAFLELTVEHRSVLVLTHYVGLPAAEVAEILGIPTGTVYSRLHHGSRAMRASLGRQSSVPLTASEHGR